MVSEAKSPNSPIQSLCWDSRLRLGNRGKWKREHENADNYFTATARKVYEAIPQVLLSSMPGTVQPGHHERRQNTISSLSSVCPSLRGKRIETTRKGGGTSLQSRKCCVKPSEYYSLLDPPRWTLKHPENKQAGTREANQGIKLPSRACGPALPPPLCDFHLSWCSVREETKSEDRRGSHIIPAKPWPEPWELLWFSNSSFKGLGHYQYQYQYLGLYQYQFSSLVFLQLKEEREGRINRWREGERQGWCVEEEGRKKKKEQST